MDFEIPWTFPRRKVAQIFLPVNSVANSQLSGMQETTSITSLHYLVKHKYPKTNNVYRWAESLVIKF